MANWRYDWGEVRNIMKHGKQQMQYPTPKQKQYIKKIEKATGVKFGGKYRWQANEYIEKYKNGELTK